MKPASLSPLTFVLIVLYMTPVFAQATAQGVKLSDDKLAPGSTIDLTGRLPEIRTPLTIVYASPHARAGATIDRQYAQAYARARQTRFVRVDNSGHMIMYDQPGRLAEAMRAFLR